MIFDLFLIFENGPSNKGVDIRIVPTATIAHAANCPDQPPKTHDTTVVTRHTVSEQAGPDKQPNFPCSLNLPRLTAEAAKAGLVYRLEQISLKCLKV